MDLLEERLGGKRMLHESERKRIALALNNLFDSIFGPFYVMNKRDRWRMLLRENSVRGKRTTAYLHELSLRKLPSRRRRTGRGLAHRKTFGLQMGNR